jgi:AcrR family transcriptional regulator
MASASARRSRREERKEETRAELIAAATKVFAKRGFYGASMEVIAAEAGYSTGALYWHFASKDDLFLAVYEEYAVMRVRELEETTQQGSELVANARAAADNWMQRAGENEEWLVLGLEFLVHAWRNPAIGTAFATRDAAVPDALARMLKARVDANELALPMPAEDIALALRELGAGLAYARLADPELVRNGLFGDFVQLFFEMLLDRARN